MLIPSSFTHSTRSLSSFPHIHGLDEVLQPFSVEQIGQSRRRVRRARSLHSTAQWSKSDAQLTECKYDQDASTRR